MRNLLWFFAVLIMLFIQTGILFPLRLTPVNLILIMVCSAALISEFNTGLIIAMIGGLLMDFLSGSPDGLITASLLFVFLILYFVLNSLISREPNRFVLFSAVAVATVGFFAFFLGFNQVFSFFKISNSINLEYYFSVQLPIALVLNLVLTYPVFKFCLWVQNLIPSESTT